MAIKPMFPQSPTHNADLDAKLSKLEILLTPFLTEGFEPKRGRLLSDTPYPIFNPTTLVGDDDIIFISRMTNQIHRMDGLLDVTGGGRYAANVIHKADPGLTQFRHSVLDETEMRRGCDAAPYGLEDIRLFRWKGGIWGIGSGIKRTADMRPLVTQVLVRIENDRIVEFFVLKSPFDFAVEKNWMPLIQDEQLFFIYSLSPQIVLEYRGSNLVMVKGERISDNRFQLCGGTPFVRFGNQYLAIGHCRERIHGKQFYRHFFVLLDKNLKCDEISEPFFIQRRGVEFVCGLAPYGDDFLMSYGVGDRSSYYCILPSAQLTRWIVG